MRQKFCMGFKKGIHKCVECEKKWKKILMILGCVANVVQQKLVLKKQYTKNYLMKEDSHNLISDMPILNS